MRKKLWFALLLLAVCLVPLGFAAAAGTRTGTVYVAKDEIISGNLYVAGDSVTVDGTVSGDLISAARSIRVSGRVEGDIIAAAQEIVVDGSVGGNIRIAGNSLTINGSVARNVNAFGAFVVLGPESRVGWDAYLAGAMAEIRGVIDGSLSGQAGQVILAGQVGKDVNLTLEPGADQTALTLAPTAVINGNLNYTSREAASVAPEATIGGEINQTIPAAKEQGGFAPWLGKRLWAIFSAFVVGLVLIYLVKEPTAKITDKIKDTPARMILPGLIILFILPPIAFVLAITVIGLPLALITAALWLILMYVGKILAAIAAGGWLLGMMNKDAARNAIWPMIAGVIVVWLLAGIPYVGWLLCLAATVVGLGGIWNYAYRER